MTTSLEEWTRLVHLGMRHLVIPRIPHNLIDVLSNVSLCIFDPRTVCIRGSWSSGV